MCINILRVPTVQLSNYRKINQLDLARNFPSFCTYSMLYSPNPCHQTRSRAGLGIDVVQMKLDRSRADVNFNSDCLIGFPGNQQLKDFQLTWCEVRYAYHFATLELVSNIMTRVRLFSVYFD